MTQAGTAVHFYCRLTAKDEVTGPYAAEIIRVFSPSIVNLLVHPRTTRSRVEHNVEHKSDTASHARYWVEIPPYQSKPAQAPKAAAAAAAAVAASKAAPAPKAKAVESKPKPAKSEAAKPKSEKKGP